MQISKGPIKQKIYRRTERRREPAFVEIRQRAQSDTVKCPYCRNLFFGPDRGAALQHLDNHIMRKHFDRVRAVWNEVSEILFSPQGAATAAFSPNLDATTACYGEILVEPAGPGVGNATVMKRT
ncbi:MAG TPA: hypothetical protein VNI77_12480 [Nitrososphaera sp.]|nr:hypothetical protein [Nitrososphaera sp.]